MSEDPEQQALLHQQPPPLQYMQSTKVGSKTGRAVAAAEAEEGPFPSPLKAMLLAEFFGTCLFVQLGMAADCSGLYLNAFRGSMYPIGVAWGLSLLAGIYVAAAQSGAHLNPAVSFSFALVRPADFRFRKLIPYWVVQVLAASVAAMINLALFHHSLASFEKAHKIVRGTPQSAASASAFVNYYSTRPQDIRNMVHAMFVEGLGTAVLVFSLFIWTHRRNPVPGAAVPALVGMVYALLQAGLGPLTGAPLNPARDMGPRLVAATLGHWGWQTSMQDWLPYLVGPMVGGPIGAFFADKVLMAQ